MRTYIYNWFDYALLLHKKAITLEVSNEDTA